LKNALKRIFAENNKKTVLGKWADLLKNERL
jgi:hypothetical protein